MSKDFCTDCGVLLSPHTRICSVCGFDNNYDDYDELDHIFDDDPSAVFNDEFVPENYPGF